MKIILSVINAKQIHKALAPWYLKAYYEKTFNTSEIVIKEHSINDDINRTVNELYLEKPDIIGFSCYIWNIDYVKRTMSMLKKFLPNLIIILGGPEVSFEEDFSAFEIADYIIKGAGEVTFAELIKELENKNYLKTHGKKIIDASGISSFEFSALPSPFTDDYFNSFLKTESIIPIGNQLIYYESARGCPFSCSYCLSSATSGVSYLSLERVFSELAMLISKGAMCIKFVDRSFNANKKRAGEILAFILKLETNCTFHFEIVADLFDEELLFIISEMPIGRVQFEIGIQSVNQKTLDAVCRKTDTEKVCENIKKLMEFTNCHIHIDLIAGLPFDSLNDFKNSICTCLELRPHMIQLGILKMLKGSEIRTRHLTHGYVFNEFAPYDIFKNKYLGFDDLIELKAVEEVIDRFYNSGKFINTINYAVSLFSSGYDLFHRLFIFMGDRINLKMSLKASYNIMLDFLISEGARREEAEHYIKLDCLTFDPKGMLPDSIIYKRDKEAENDYKKKSQAKNVRIEYFCFDNKNRTFIYDYKNPVDNSYLVIEYK